MAGRHRRPPVWRRAVSTSLARLVRSRNRARTAALRAEVVALRATVAELRAELETTLARSAELAEELTVARAAAAAAIVAEPAVVPAGPSLQLPLVRLALDREAEPALTYDMALALAAPDRGEDTARTDIVLRDLPERALLDPRSDRDDDAADPAAAAPAAAAAGSAEVAEQEPVRRIA